MNWKSAIIGLLLGSLLVMLLGAAGSNWQCSAVIDSQGWVILVRMNSHTGDVQVRRIGNMTVSDRHWGSVP